VFPDLHPAFSGHPEICVLSNCDCSVSTRSPHLPTSLNQWHKRIIPLSIAGQHKLYSALSKFLSIIGYWSGALSNVIVDVDSADHLRSIAGCWAAAVLVEHIYFRKADFALYDLQSWNVPSRLPLGAAALTASALSFALIIPSMDQVWYMGPIARTTGDIGIEMALVITALLYVPLRYFEKRWKGV
jgi:purine-cytosine permease-like protein